MMTTADVEATEALQAAFDSTEDGLIQPAAVRVIRSVNVGDQLRRFEMNVANCGNDLSQVRVTVENNGVFIQSMGAFFQDGTGQSYNLNRTFNAGYQSPWISLSLIRPANKCVTRVFVDARSAGPGAPSKVTVYGNYTN